MRRTLLSIPFTTLAALPCAALAQPGDRTQIEIGVRPWGSPPETPFVEHLDFVHPDFSPAEVEVGVRYYRNAGFGLGTVVHSIVSNYGFDHDLGDDHQIPDNPGSVLHPDGRLGNFNFGGQFQVVYHDEREVAPYQRIRIGANGNANNSPSGGISIKQNTPVALGTAFDTSNGPLGYHFKLIVACAASGAPRTMTLDAPRDKVASFAVYSTSSSTTATSILASLIDSRTASITVSAPAPASFSLVLVATACMHRRRRSN